MFQLFQDGGWAMYPLLILLILQVQFRSLWTSLLVFSGVFVAWAGGFLLLGLYGWSGFMDFEVFGASGRDLFQIQPLNLSVAVWVGTDHTRAMACSPS